MEQLDSEQITHYQLLVRLCDISFGFYLELLHFSPALLLSAAKAPFQSLSILLITSPSATQI